MTRVITRPLKEDKDGIEGYIAYPERAEKGPGLLLIHQHSGLTGYLKTAAYKFAQLGYTDGDSQSLSHARLSGGAAYRQGHGDSEQDAGPGLRSRDRSRLALLPVAQ